MVYDYLTLEDFDLVDKTVYLRADINSPLDPSSKRILDATRIQAVSPTLNDLKEARVVLVAHQSRPGKYDFTSLETHARVLQMYIDNHVKYTDDIYGFEAQKEIKELKTGEVLVLNNVRMFDKENVTAPPEELAKTELVQNLYPLFDLAVNDAFAAAHRSQPSLVGFSEYLPMVAGRLMQKELDSLNTVLDSPSQPCVYLLGGVKVEDRIPVINRVLRDGISDNVLIGGLVGDYFHLAEGHMSNRLEELDAKNLKLVNEAKELIEKYPDMIELPLDVALDVNGERVEIMTEKLTDETNVYDIGLNTIAHFSEKIKGAGTVVAEGPLGMFERRGFDTGTKELLRVMARCKGYTVVGGGHMGALANMLDVDKHMGHISTGGGALLALIAGRQLPVIEALERAKKRYM
jgi:phosphoglycerate kinase